MAKYVYDLSGAEQACLGFYMQHHVSERQKMKECAKLVWDVGQRIAEEVRQHPLEGGE